MKQQLKDDLIATAILSPVAIGSASLFYWGFGWAWWVAILSAIIIPPAFGFLAGELVAHSVILYLDEKTKK